MRGDYPHLPEWLDDAVDSIDNSYLGPDIAMCSDMHMLQLRLELHALAKRTDLDLRDLHKPVTLDALKVHIGMTAADGILAGDFSAVAPVEAACAALEVLHDGGSRQEAALRCLYAQISSDLHSPAGELARFALHALTHYGSTSFARTLLMMLRPDHAAEVLIRCWKQAPCAA